MLRDTGTRKSRQAGSGRSQPQATENLERAGRLFLPEVLFALLLIGTVLTFNRGVTAVDGLLVLIVVVYVPSILRLRNPMFSMVLRRVGIPMALYVGLGVLLIVVVGNSVSASGQSSGPETLLKDAFSFAFFFVGLALLLLVTKRPSLWAPKAALVLAASVLFVSTLIDAIAGAPRPDGLFYNPNLTGSWFAGAFVAILVLGYPRRLLYRVGALTMCLAGILLTSSMGALGAALAGATYFLISKTPIRTMWKVALGVPAALTALLLIPSLDRFLFLSASEGTTRFDESADGRLEIWVQGFRTWIDNPLGLGPGGFSDSDAAAMTLQGAEAHNDYLGILVDYGILGLIVWLFVLAGLFAIAGKARPLVIFLAVTSLFHSALNFRHSWILLALGLAAAYWDSRPEPHELNAQPDNRDTKSGPAIRRTPRHVPTMANTPPIP